MNHLKRIDRLAVGSRVAMVAMTLCLIQATTSAQELPRATPEVQSLLDAAQNVRDDNPSRAEKTLKSVEKALDRARTSRDKRGEVDALRAKGNIRAALGKPDEALSLYKESQGIAEQYGDT